jgi:hypothetical protein
MKDTISIETLNWCQDGKARFRQKGLCCQETKKELNIFRNFRTRRNRFFSIGIFRYDATAKEGYSSYVFEDTAAQILKDNPKLKEALQQKKRTPFF